MLYGHPEIDLKPRLKKRFVLLFLGTIVGLNLLALFSCAVRGLPRWLVPSVAVTWLAIFMGDIVVNYVMKCAKLYIVDDVLVLRVGFRRSTHWLKGATADLGQHFSDSSMRKEEGTVCHLSFADGSQPVSILVVGAEVEPGERTARDTHGDQVHWRIEYFDYSSPNEDLQTLLNELTQKGMKLGSGRGKSFPQR